MIRWPWTHKIDRGDDAVREAEDALKRVTHDRDTLHELWSRIEEIRMRDDFTNEVRRAIRKGNNDDRE